MRITRHGWLVLLTAVCSLLAPATQAAKFGGDITLRHEADAEIPVQDMVELMRQEDVLAPELLQGIKPIHQAALDGNVTELSRLVAEKSKNAKLKTKEGFTPLHLAAWNGHLEAVKFLVAAEVKLDAPSKEGLTALHLAAIQGQVEVARHLLESGAGPNVVDKYGAFHPLHYATRGDHAELIRLLLGAGAEVDKRSRHGWTALHVAAFRDLRAVAAFLLEGKADLDRADFKGWTPLHLAAQEGHKGTVQLLLASGADTDSKSNRGMSALHSAAVRGMLDVVEVLLDQGLPIDAKDNQGCTPLHLASWARPKEMSNAQREWTVRVNHGCSRVVELLLERGAKINARDDQHRTPLDFAQHYGNKKIAELLLAGGGESKETRRSR